MTKNTATTIITLLLAICYPLMQIVSNNHWTLLANWPDIGAALCAIVYGYFTGNQDKWGAKVVNYVTTTAGALVGCFVALGPIVATGTITMQAAMMAIVAAAIGYFTHNPDQADILVKELAKTGVSLPGKE